MTVLFKKRPNKIGVPPGTLIHVGSKKDNKIVLELVDYDKKTVNEKINPTIEECLSCMSINTVTWIHVGGVHEPQIVAAIGKQLGLHPLMMEDILNTGQRAKLDDYHDYLFVVTRALKFNEDKNEVEDQQVSIVLGKSFIFSFTESPDNPFATVKERIKNEQSRFRVSGADYLAYALIDTIVDHYFVVLEQVDNHLEHLDGVLVDKPGEATLHQIQKIKRVMTLLRKWIWPMREVASQLMRTESSLIADGTKIYLRDVHDHAIYAIETIEGFRDIVSGMVDLYLSSISLRLNEVMKVLTIVSTIFVPLTFITSLYGMNFEHMPELTWHYGYPFAILLMIGTAVGMLSFFRYRRWI